MKRNKRGQFKRKGAFDNLMEDLKHFVFATVVIGVSMFTLLLILKF